MSDYLIPNYKPKEVGVAFFGNLTPAEIMHCDALCAEQDITVAVLKKGEVIDKALFRDLETAEAFLRDGVWPEADAVMELPDGFCIGDSYINGEWIKAPEPAMERT